MKITGAQFIDPGKGSVWVPLRNGVLIFDGENAARLRAQYSEQLRSGVEDWNMRLVLDLEFENPVGEIVRTPLFQECKQ